MEVPEDLCDRLRRLEGYRGKAMRTARRCLSSYEDAQDAVQETLIKVALVPDLDWNRVGGLVSTTARNVCIDMIRSNARRARRDSLYFQQEVYASDVGDEVVEQLAARWLGANLHRLSVTERTILQLHAEGKSVADIADAVGLTYKGAHASLTRAKRRMTAVWQAALGTVLLGALNARVRRGAFVAGAVGFGLAVTLTPSFHGMRGEPEPVVSVPDERPTATVEHEPALPKTAISDSGKQSLHLTPRRNHSSGLAKTVVVLGSTSVGPVQTRGPVEISFSDPESPVASLLSCLEVGLELDIHHIGCAWERDRLHKL